MEPDALTRAAIEHTLHCLLGCSIGEVLGMSLTTWLGWATFEKVIFAVPLAFLFGYLLTSWSLVQKGTPWREAVSTALATDTVSILSMETIDSAFLLLVPGAMNAHLTDAVYWIKLFSSLASAFIITVPVNRYLIGRNPHRYHHHH